MMHFKNYGSSRLPVLMYHDVSSALNGVQRFGIPKYYCIPPNSFREQLHSLHANGYRAVIYHDAPQVKEDEKAVVITFDDGWKGNITQAVPILKEFNFPAVFFVTVNSIGSQDYMSWDDLQSILAAGMCVQSHGMTHRPMEDLDPSELASELHESKVSLEKRLGQSIDAISFPHGSYNKEIIRRAAEVGFRFFFTSDISPTYPSSFMVYPRTLARMSITTNVTSEMLIKRCQYRGIGYYRDYLTFRLKRFVRRTVGINNYRRIYRTVYRINSREDNYG